jgi:hypothetical protein
MDVSFIVGAAALARPRHVTGHHEVQPTRHTGAMAAGDRQAIQMDGVSAAARPEREAVERVALS